MKKLLTLVIATVTVFTGQAQTKHVLIEEHTGSWCQWCTGGTHTLNEVTQNLSNTIPIAIHSNDPMEYNSYLSATGLTSAPSANIDRDVMGAGIGSWMSAAQSALNNTPKADIDVYTSFDPSSRVLTARVKATFAAAATGNYRLGGIIVEDGVHGPSPSYDQSNSYSGGSNGPMGGFENLPSQVPGYMISYNHVARELLGGYNGQSGSVPANVSAGDTASYTFTYTLPAAWNENMIRVIGVLIDPNNQIDNCNKSSFLDGSQNASPVITSEPMTEGYVNANYTFDLFASDADDCNLTVTATTLPSWLTMNTPTAVGCIHTKATVSGTPTATGQYPVVLEVSDGAKTTTLSYTIIIDDAFAGNWELVGMENFTDSYSNYGIVADKNGTLYTLIEDDNGNTNVFQKTSGGNWTNYGNLNASNPNYARIVLASDQLTPWVAYTNSQGVYVEKYDNGSWTQVGGNIGSGVQIGFDLNANDQPYVAFQDGGQGYFGGCYTYDGSNWNLVGNGVFSNGPAVWNDLKINRSTGDVYVLYTDWNAGQTATVTKWDGTNWSDLGGGAVSASQVQFDQSLTIHEASNTVYVAFSRYISTNDTRIDVYSFSGTSWTQIGNDISGDVAEGVNLTINDAKVLMVSFIDQGANGSISAMSNATNNWSFIGPRGFSGSGCTSTYITSYNNYPYVVYKNNTSDLATVKYFDAPLEIVSVSQLMTYEEDRMFFPNPAHTVLQNTERKSIHIYTIAGVEVYRGNAPSIDVSNWQTGMYIITTGNKVEKLVIRH